MTSFEKRLDPQIRAIIQQMPPRLDPDKDLVEVRKFVESMPKDIPAPNPDVLRENRAIPGCEGDPDVTVRIYRVAERADMPAPALIWIHGGGFFLGNTEDNDEFCEQVVLETGAVVVSVEYRRAPEHPFPAAVHDCYAALKWVVFASNELHVDTSRIAVGGASAGGNLAAAIALMTRDHGGPALCFQFLIIPVVDDRHETPSSYEVTDLRIWNRGISIKAWAAYLADSEGEVSPYAAPARAEDLSGLPPAYVYVEGVDFLRDEGIAYATRLMQAGVPTELHVCPGMFHGAFSFAPEAEISKRVTNEHMAVLKRAFAPKV